MAFITGKIPQGNCGAVTYNGNGHYTCSPLPDQPGIDPRAADPYNFYAKITGKPGETVHLHIQWPIFDDALCPDRKYKNKAFFYSAHKCIYISPDELNWQRMEDVQVDEENWIDSLTLTLEEPVCYVSVNYYYTCRMFEALRADMAASPLAEEKVVGLARDGQEMILFKVTDPSVPLEEKQIIYLQAGQHCCEYGGMHLMDGVLRFLTGGAAGALLKKYEFHVLPVFSVADWTSGYKDELGADPNTVWDTLCRSENQAVDAYLRSLPKKPSLLLDAHNSSRNFLFISDYVEPERVAKQLRFAELLAEHCDYMERGSIKRTQVDKYANFKQYALKHFGYGFTAELSRFWLYDRETQQNIPLSKEGFARFGAQLPIAIDEFISGL